MGLERIRTQRDLPVVRADRVGRSPEREQRVAAHELKARNRRLQGDCAIENRKRPDEIALLQLADSEQAQRLGMRRRDAQNLAVFSLRARELSCAMPFQRGLDSIRECVQR